MPILPLPHISVLVCHSSKSTECLPYVCSTLGAADTTGIRWSWARPSGSAHHTLWFPTGRKELPYNSAASSCISWWLGMVVVIAHPSSCCALCVLVLPCEVSRPAFTLSQGQSCLSAWGEGGMFFLLRETQMFKTVPRARVFILDGAIFFMEWKTAVFSCPH